MVPHSGALSTVRTAPTAITGGSCVRIVSVTPHAEYPTDAVVIDASDRSVLPGLILRRLIFG